MIRQIEQWIQEHRLYQSLCFVSNKYMRQAQQRVIDNGLYEDWIAHQAYILASLDKSKLEGKMSYKYIYKSLYQFLRDYGFRRVRVNGKRYWIVGDVNEGRYNA